MPTVKLTQRLLDDLSGAEPPAKDEFYWSERMPGFGVKRKGSSGTLSFCAQWRDRRTNKTHRLALGRVGKVSLEGARKAAEQVFDQVAAGKNPIEDRNAYREAWTFAELADDYLGSSDWAKKAASTRLND